MADHSERHVPDYDVGDTLDLDNEQMRLLLEPTRMQIIDLLSERAATTSQLADVMGRPKGTIGHHCKALEAAGLIHVVRTARVRAIEERYYGRTARLFMLGSFEAAGVSVDAFLDEAYGELKQAATSPYKPDVAHEASVRYARIPHDRAEEWATKVADLLDEFAAQPRAGDTTYGLLVGIFATERPGFGDDDE